MIEKVCSLVLNRLTQLKSTWKIQTGYIRSLKMALNETGDMKGLIVSIGSYGGLNSILAMGKQIQHKGVSFKNMMLRVPDSINSKNGQGVTELQ